MVTNLDLYLQLRRLVVVRRKLRRNLRKKLDNHQVNVVHRLLHLTAVQRKDPRIRNVNIAPTVIPPVVPVQDAVRAEKGASLDVAAVVDPQIVVKGNGNANAKGNARGNVADVKETDEKGPESVVDRLKDADVRVHALDDVQETDRETGAAPVPADVRVRPDVLVDARVIDAPGTDVRETGVLEIDPGTGSHETVQETGGPRIENLAIEGPVISLRSGWKNLCPYQGKKTLKNYTSQLNGTLFHQSARKNMLRVLVGNHLWQTINLLQ
ncbi:unnamed protein product [Parnassius mnemosyne]|uniref:Uncharacterized protein n=1 Tax=Parnassius mnemosyne TaxID=213953 RepID=A0AAV1MAS1_9NEOP